MQTTSFFINTKLKQLLALCALTIALPAAAQFRVEVSGVGLTQMPIAIATFRGEAQAPQKIGAIVKADLERSGVFRAVDTVGAVIGPLLAIWLMVLFVGDIRTVLWFAVPPAVIAVALVLFAVREPADTAHRPARLPISRDGLAQLGSAYWRIVLVGGLLSLARFSEAFLVLRAAERGLSNTYVPLVLVVMSLVYTVTAYPAGRLSDRIPRRVLLLVGIALLIAADAVLALADTPLLVLIGVAVWGAHMGLTQGMLATLIADVALPQHRGTAFGMFNLVAGVALLIASALAGLLWDVGGPALTFLVGGCLAALTWLAALVMLPASPTRTV